jgi:predicted 3-demethylubiquinone-9 3-methyltransferase (glyoxalase superfamily)
MTGKAFVACLWFDTEGEAAANYCTSIFADSKIGRVARYTEAGRVGFHRRVRAQPVHGSWSIKINLRL